MANNKFANINTSANADAVKQAAAGIVPPAPTAPSTPVANMDEAKAKLSMDSKPVIDMSPQTSTPPKEETEEQRKAREAREALKAEKQNIQAESAEHTSSEEVKLLRKEVARASEIVGYIAATDARIEVASKSKKSEDGKTTTVTHVPVHRPPTGRISTLVKIPARAVTILGNQHSSSSDTTLTTADYSDVMILAIPEEDLNVKMVQLFGGKVREAEAIRQEFIKTSKGGATSFGADVPEYLESRPVLRKVAKGDGKEKQLTIRTKPTIRSKAFNTVNYIPNKVIDTLPLNALTSEQVKGLNMAYFYRELAKTGAVVNSNIERVAGRSLDTSTTGLMIDNEGNVTSNVFKEGTITDFFRGKVAHWYDRTAEGSSVMISDSDLRIPNKEGSLTDSENKLTVKTTAKSLDAKDPSKAWSFKLEDFPAIAAASQIQGKPAIDGEFIKGAIEEQKMSRASASGRGGSTNSTAKLDASVMDALVNKALSNENATLGSAKIIL